MEVGSPRTDAQGNVGDGQERELSDVAGTLRSSDTTQQGVPAAVSFTIARAPVTSVTFLILGFRPFLFCSNIEDESFFVLSKCVW